MKRVKILNSKEAKELISLINSRFGSSFRTACGFLMTNNKRVFLINKEISLLNTKNLIMSRIGLYFVRIEEKFTNNRVRLSIEGAQLVGKTATENVVEIDKEEVKAWFSGEDLTLKNIPKNVTPGFVILKYNNNFLGCGLLKDNKIKNYVPKERRVKLYA